MPKFGYRSRARLSSCDQRLIDLFEEVIKYVDCSVISGHRGKDEQDDLCRNGKSQLKYPKSRHNSTPSMAADVVPYPVDWKDIDRFREFIGFVKGVASQLGIEIECGSDWRTFKDYPHFQIKGD